MPERVTAGQYEQRMRFRAISPSFVADSPSLASLNMKDYSYEKGSTFDVIKHFAYNGTATYYDKATDPGHVRVIFEQTTAEMKAIRRYLLVTARENTVVMPSFGISKPFGDRMGAGPFNCKIIAWKDQPKTDRNYWSIQIVFRRVR